MGFEISTTNSGRRIANSAFDAGNAESVNLQVFKFDYDELQFTISVNGKIERAIKKISQNSFWFESESLKISPDYLKYKTNMIIENITNKTISFIIYVQPWIDPYDNIINDIYEKINNITPVIKDKIFPVIEFSPTLNQATSFTHNLDIATADLSIKIIDYSDAKYLKHSVLAKFSGNEYKYENIVIAGNKANPKNFIDIKFIGEKSPKYCQAKIEGKTFVLEIMDSSNKEFKYKKALLKEGESEEVQHNIETDFSKIDVFVKIEYLVAGRAIHVPGNVPRKTSFTKILNKQFLNVFNDVVVGEGNLSVSVNDTNNLVFSNTVDQKANHFDAIGYSVELTTSKLELTAHIELSQLSRSARSVNYKYID
ncbi:hypothetical protein [Fluviispira vulneris]|uniref:hypothetical protein n=1 Tax=Fluviispira vulneris TaxID=2763012 RepID=UPI0016470C79|nr:hypothetical protein [Fluviispira vulneris]